MALALLTTALPSSVVTASSGSLMETHSDYREAGYKQTSTGMTTYFRDNYGPDWTCRKVDRGGEFTTTRDHGAIVIKNDQRFIIFKPAPAGTYTTNKGVSHWYKCNKPTPPKKKRILRYGGRILGPCGDPWYTARIWNGKRSTRPVTIILEVRGGRTLWKRTLQPGQSVKPRATWLPGGKMLILRRGNGSIIDRERTVTGTYSWSECRNG